MSESKFNNIISSIDLFGVNLSFKYLKREKHGSVFGAFLTLIFIVILVYKTILFIIKVVTKDDLDYKVQETPLSLDDIELKNFTLKLCPYLSYLQDEYDSENLNLDDIFELNVNLTNYNDNVTIDRLDLPKTYKINITDRCYTISYNDTMFAKINSTKSLYENAYLKVKFIVNIDKLKEVAGNFPNQELDELTAVSIIMQKNYVNISDFYNLFNKYENELLLNINGGKNIEIIQNVDKLGTQIVDDIYTFGLVEPDKKTEYTYTLGQRDIIHNTINDNDIGILNFEFRHSKILKLYIITSFSIESFLGQFGGYIQLILIFFNTIGQAYNSWILERKIEKYFKGNILNMKDTVNYLEEYLDIQKSKREEMIRSNEKEKLSINNENSKEKNELFIEDDRESKVNNNFIVKYNTNSVYETIKKKIVKKKNSIKIDYINKKYYNEMIEDFIFQFDYDKFYNLIKEIKLIKLFALNKEELKLISSIECVPFKIDRFDEVIKSFNYDENDKIILFENKIEKIKEFLTNH